MEESSLYKLQNFGFSMGSSSPLFENDAQQSGGF
jgi:hypothetical protein